MRSFEEIFAIAAERHGGAAALEAKLPKPTPARTLKALGDDRWLAGMTRSIFQSGFSWKVIEAKWPGFEAAFKGFDVHACAAMDDAWFDRLTQDTGIVRNPIKIRTVPQNAAMLLALAQEHGKPAGHVIVDWPDADYVGLLTLLKDRGAHLGGVTGSYCLRQIGRDGFVFSKDVVARLVAEGVVEKTPTSKKALAQAQAAFNAWREESGRSMTEISRVLAMSIG